MSSPPRASMDPGLHYRLGWLPMYPLVLIFTAAMKLKNRRLANDDRYVEHQVAFFSFSERVQRWLGRDYFHPSDKFHNQRPILTEYAFADLDTGPLRMLDIATGCGFQAKALGDAGAMEVCGIDIVSGRVRAARRLFGQEAMSFIQMDATSLAFPDNCFDATTVSVALHDMPTTTKEKAIAEMVRVTKSQGNVVIFEPRTFRNKLVGFGLGLVGELLDESLNIQEFVMHDLNPILEAQGLELVREQNTFVLDLLNIKQCRVNGDRAC